MNKINKIALKIAKKSLTIRELLKKKINLEITYGLDESFKLNFSGPINLTPNGVARWGHLLNTNILIDDDNTANIIDVLSNQQIQDICSLFNTIAGNVNEDTYNKYIDN